MSQHLAVNFHYVGMSKMPYPGIHGLDVEAFRAVLAELVRVHQFVSLPEIMKAVRHGGVLPERACLLTFDDGLRCHFDVVLPIIDELDIPAAFFVATAPLEHGKALTVHRAHFARANLGDHEILTLLAKWYEQGGLQVHPDAIGEEKVRQCYPYDDKDGARVKYLFNYVVAPEVAEGLLDRLFAQMGMREDIFVDQYYMTPAMIQELAQRDMVGSHTARHINLAALSSEEVKNELQESKVVLERIGGRPVQAISYPFGNTQAVNRTIGELAGATGYTVGWTMERARNYSIGDPLLFARIDVNDVKNIATLSGRTGYLNETARV